MTFHHTVLAHVRESWKKHKKPIIYTTATGAVFLVLIVGGTFGYVKYFEGKIYPSVSVGGVPVGGLTQEEASWKLQSAYNSLLDRGVPVRFEDSEDFTVLDLRTSGSTDPDLVYDLVDFNADEATNAAFSIGRKHNQWFLDSVDSLMQLARPVRIAPNFTVAEEKLREELELQFGDREQQGKQTTFVISTEGEETTVDAVIGEQGTMLSTEAFFQALYRDMLDFSLEEQRVTLVNGEEIVSTDEALALKDHVVSALDEAPYTLTHTSDAQLEYEWIITEEDLQTSLVPVRTEEGSLALGIDAVQMTDLLAEIHEDVDTEPQNARFRVEGSRVVEFAGSLDGERLQEEETIEAINAALGIEDAVIQIAVEVIEPSVTTESVNSLGITEIVGVGTSDFSGSPSNRIQNIQHGARKLDGLLIAPGEEFSLVEALKPFTIADGWLPELVIKGDEILPEVGGGACQFGTTLFRAAMNSGLEITQRRNHSLAISYYNDPKNGNPGTDATIYDPAPDFRFRNDTENYLLLETNVDLTTQEMVFTFWGTSDGRKGSYTPPQVLSRTGYGAAIVKETDTLAPGVRRCQGGYSGAVTSFDYMVEYADGEVFTHTYTSTYRSLPPTCLVGKNDAEPEVTPEPVTATEESEAVTEEAV